MLVLLLSSDTTLKNFKAAFRILDLDGSGSIDEEELLIGLQSVGCNPSPDRLSAMMAAADVDKSGQIDFCEFVIVMQKQREEQSCDTCDGGPVEENGIKLALQEHVECNKTAKNNYSHAKIAPMM